MSISWRKAHTPCLFFDRIFRCYSKYMWTNWSFNSNLLKPFLEAPSNRDCCASQNMSVNAANLFLLLFERQTWINHMALRFIPLIVLSGCLRGDVTYIALFWFGAVVEPCYNLTQAACQRSMVGIVHQVSYAGGHNPSLQWHPVPPLDTPRHPLGALR